LRNHEKQEIMDIGRIAHGGVYIYRGELDFMARTILDSPHMETGGNLFGYWTPSGDAVIMYVLGPGRKSVCRFTSFIQDADYLQLHADRLFEEYHLSHIGVWHSHHGLGLSHPSGGDVQSIQEGMLADGLSRCILAIGICDRAGASVNAFSFVCTGEGVKMNLVPWNVVQGDGSVRSRYDAAYRDSVIMPQVKEAVYHGLNMIPVQQMPPENGVTFDTGFWLNNKENRLQLKRIVSYIQSKYSAVKLLKVDDMTIEIRFDIPRRSSWRIVFDKDFPSRAPYVVRYEAGETTSWSLGGLGTALSYIAAGKAGAAISYALGQGAPMIAALWGVFIWKEFTGSSKSTDRLLGVMFILFITGLSFIVLSGGN
jgi:hypothetical protein